MTFDEAVYPTDSMELNIEPCSETTMGQDPSKKLIVALDVPTVPEARELVKKLGSTVSFYKIGLELIFGGGLEFAKELKREGNQVFLDMKLLDIGNTVEKAVRNIALLGFDYLTVHGTDRKTLEAAVRGKGNSNLNLLAVTVLTNLERTDLQEQGIHDYDPVQLVLHRAKMAEEAGFQGVIASGNEARAIRENIENSNFVIKTPGIRLTGVDSKDQTRAITPAQAIANGADYLVVGRPITQAADPKAAAELFVAEIDAAMVPAARQS